MRAELVVDGRVFVVKRFEWPHLMRFSDCQILDDKRANLFLDPDSEAFAEVSRVWPEHPTRVCCRLIDEQGIPQFVGLLHFIQQPLVRYSETRKLIFIVDPRTVPAPRKGLARAGLLYG